MKTTFAVLVSLALCACAAPPKIQQDAALHVIGHVCKRGSVVALRVVIDAPAGQSIAEVEWDNDGICGDPS